MAELVSKKIDSKNIGMVSSTAVRAYSTAMEFGKKFGIDKDDIFQEEDLYLADENEILDTVKIAMDEFDTVFVYCHNPGITYAANRLSNTNIENVPTCGVVCMDFDIDSWKNISFGNGELKFFEYPKKYYKEP
jgi:phosphohistidine phosphatase